MPLISVVQNSVNCRKTTILSNNIVVREVLHDQAYINKASNKYLEKITLNNNIERHKNFLIVIGGNPALCNELLIDKTNQKIIEALNNNMVGNGKTYDGYYLMNLYSNISSNYKALCQNPCSMMPIIDQNVLNLNYDILIIWGPGLTNKLKPSLNSKIGKFITKNPSNVIVSVDKSNNACHGCRASNYIKYSNAKNTRNLWR